MAPYVFTIREEARVPRRYTVRGTPGFAREGYADQHHEKYRLIEDEEIAEKLKDVNRRRDPAVFRYLTPDELEAALGSAEDAIGAIEAGEHDEDLDMLLHAERALENRVTVARAILKRSDELATQEAQQQEYERVEPEDLETAREA